MRKNLPSSGDDARGLLVALLLGEDAAAVFLDVKPQLAGPRLAVAEQGAEVLIVKLYAVCLTRPVGDVPHELVLLVGADKKGLITVGGRDPRMTRTGYLIRKYKLDELPQLFNVLKGDMSLVGPRPEVRKYVDLYTDEQKKLLSVRPGITDYASIEYVDENMILGEASDPDRAYIEQIMPDKIRYNMKYICNRSVKEYFKIIFLTFWSIIR